MINILPLDVNNDEDIRQSHELFVVLNRESSPDDPPPTREALTKGFRNIPSFISHSDWKVMLSEGVMGGRAACVWEDNVGHNEHIAWIQVDVHPQMRRQGVGTQLLTIACEAAQKAGRTLLMMSSSSTVPAGEAFLTQMGAQVGLTERISQLRTSEIDQYLITSWCQNTVPGFTMGFWEGAYPPESLPEIVRLRELTNDIPRGDLQMEDSHTTVEQLQQMEESMIARGIERWAFYLRDEATGEIAGYTDITLPPSRPYLAHQGLTAVWKKYRGKGLGRWLKGAMLQKLLTERPNVNLIRTGNATSNAPMLKINTELGFQLYRTSIEWQIPLETAQDWAKNRLLK